MRLTQYAHGGGCACKIQPGELEQVVAGLLVPGPSRGDLLVGLDDGDDAAVVRIDAGRAVLLTVDFLTPVVDDAQDVAVPAARVLNTAPSAETDPVARLFT